MSTLLVSDNEMAEARASLARVATGSGPSRPSVSVAGWQNLTSAQSSSPSPRHYVGMAYDAKDGYVVLFGGYNEGTFYPDTWKFMDGHWSALSPAKSPSARGMVAMTYDAEDGYVLLFGGWDGSGYLNDTWEFSAGNWTELSPTRAPSEREMSAMAYDSTDKYVVLFGGYDGTSTLGDTWRFVGGQWQELNPPVNPPARDTASLTNDPADGELVLFGGCALHDCTIGLHDTWVFQGGAWTHLTPSPAPPGRASATLTYDSVDGYVLLYGGENTTYFADTWIFENGTWSELTPSSAPSMRWGAGATADPPDGYVLLFGGVNGTNLGDTWAWEDRPLISTPAPSANPVDVYEWVNFSAVASAGSGSYPQYHWVASSSALGCTNMNTATLSCYPTEAGNDYYVTVSVTDSFGVNSNVTTSPTITVHPDPIVSSPSPDPATVDIGQTVAFTTTAQSGSGSYPTYTWTESSSDLGCSLANAPQITCSPVDAGTTLTVTVSVTDSLGGTSLRATSSDYTVFSDPTVTAPLANLGEGMVGQSVTFRTSGSGGTGNYLNYSWAPSNASLGCVASDSDQITCTPTAPGSAYTISARVMDSNRVVSVGVSSLPFNVLPAPVALGSVSMSPSSPSLSVDKSLVVSAQPTCTGGDCPSSISYAWTLLPSTLGTLNASSGDMITLTAGSATGTGNLTVTATLDGVSRSASATVTVTAAPQGSSPPTFLGFTGYTGYILLLGILVVIVIIVALLWPRSKESQRATGPPAPGPRPPPPSL